MNQTNSNNWQDKPEVKKGNIGENIVDKYLRNKGFVIYYPDKGKPHPFERLCASRDKRKLLIAEVKAKAKRTFYPDTGFNIKHYKDYCHIREKYNMPIFVYFVDEHEGKVYGNNLLELEKRREITHNFKILVYPLKQNGIIYFPRIAMIELGDIAEEEKQELKQLSKRSYSYTA